MLEHDVLHAKALLKLIELYGMDYMKKKIRNTWVAWCEKDVHTRFSFCFETADDRPDLKADYKGWIVWTTLDVDRESGEVEVVECVLPNGERVK